MTHYLPQESASALSDESADAAPSSLTALRIAALPPRCRQVLEGLMDGQSNKQIAYCLGISPRTVEVHRARLMRQLGARNVAQALRMALEAMLGPSGPPLRRTLPFGEAYPRTRSPVQASWRSPPHAGAELGGKMRK